MIMGYRAGYKFRVQSTRSPQNKEIKHKLFGKRFKERTKDDDTFICELDDNTEVEVLDYNNGSVIVKITETNTTGILG